MRMKPIAIVLALCLVLLGACQKAQDEKSVVEASKKMVPTAPWPAGDERGMANTIGSGTWMRCAYHLTQKGAKAYEISHVRSETMSSSPFGAPLDYNFRDTVGIPTTAHAFNGETVSGETAAQGTQMDAIGHFAYLPEPWDGKPPFPSEKSLYYGGFTQKDVKPTPDSPLMKLGIDKVPPIVTSAVLLDARDYVGKGSALKPGGLVTTEDIKGMVKAQGLEWRGILPGDVLYIYTGWEDNWADPDTAKEYYTKGPGLSYDAAQYLRELQVVLVALDNPFTDPANEGEIYGKAGPPEGTPPGLPFAIHHENLTQSGIHQIQNAHLSEMAKDKVWTSCTMILPLLVKGGSGSEVRPVAIGAPQG